MGDAVAVIGYGVTGRAVAGWLVGRGDEVIVLDDRADQAMVAAGRAAGVAVEPTPLDDEALRRRLDGVKLVVPSPGVQVRHPVFEAAAALGLPVRSEIELASGVCESSPNSRLIAITGTNGKTTVTTLVTAILERSGFRAVAAGNIGLPLIEAAQGDHQFVVAEVSSFQLQFTDRFRPSVSCWLNLAPDHLDWHPDLDHYAAAKGRIWINQGSGDRAVFNADDPVVAARALAAPGDVARIDFSATKPALFSVAHGQLAGPGGEPFMAVSDLPRRLPLDVANSLAAAAIAVSAGATPEACSSALAEVGAAAPSGGPGGVGGRASTGTTTRRRPPRPPSSPPSPASRPSCSSPAGATRVSTFRCAVIRGATSSGRGRYRRGGLRGGQGVRRAGADRPGRVDGGGRRAGRRAGPTR